jgi:hypothetical protein
MFVALPRIQRDLHRWLATREGKGSLRGSRRLSPVDVLLPVAATIALLAFTVVITTSLADAVAYLFAYVVSFWLVWIVWRTPPPIRARNLAPPIVVLMTAVAVTAGLSPNTAGTTLAEVQFAKGSPTPEGRYVVLGGDERGTWLLPCAAPTSATLVVSASVTLMSMIPYPTGSKPTTIFDALAMPGGLGRPIGFSPTC